MEEKKKKVGFFLSSELRIKLKRAITPRPLEDLTTQIGFVSEYQSQISVTARTARQTGEYLSLFMLLSVNTFKYLHVAVYWILCSL